MNWAKGFFRVWVIFSVLWIGAFAIVSYQSKPYFSSGYIAATADGSIDILPNYGAEAEVLDQGKSEGKIEKYKVDAFPELTFFSKNEPKSEAFGNLLRAAEKYRDKQIVENRSASFWYFIELGLGTPLALFGLGAAFAWAFRGFKRPASQP